MNLWSQLKLVRPREGYSTTYLPFIRIVGDEFLSPPHQSLPLRENPTLWSIFTCFTMPKKAPRIPEEIWNRHKEAIIASYLSRMLDQMMKHMMEEYGFEARYKVDLLRAEPSSESTC